MKTEIELILPAEIEPRAGHIVSDLRRRMPLGEVAGGHGYKRHLAEAPLVLMRSFFVLLSS
jgi:hypothetical protein